MKKVREEFGSGINTRRLTQNSSGRKIRRDEKIRQDENEGARSTTRKSTVGARYMFELSIQY